MASLGVLFRARFVQHRLVSWYEAVLDAASTPMQYHATIVLKLRCPTTF